MHVPENCLNCNSNIREDQRFCDVCGQKTNIHRLSFHELTHDIIHYFTHADKGIFQLIKELFLRPGIVAKEYTAGRRQKYFKPLNFFLIVAGLLVFVSSSFYTPNDERSESMIRYAQTMKDTVQKKAMLDMAQRNKNAAEITGKYSNIINMVATPLISVFFWLFYYRKKYNYVEHLVANMYFTGFVMIFYSLVSFPLQNLLPGLMPLWLGIFFLFEIIYRGYAYNAFINNTTTAAKVKAYLIALLVAAFWFAATTALYMTYVRTGFH